MSKPDPAAERGPMQLPRKRIPPFTEWAIPVCVVFSATLLFLALPNIISGHDLWSNAKALVLSLSAGVVAYAVNRLAIEHGAPQAAKGYLGAAIVSIVSMLAVGAGLFTATYAGLVLKDVAVLQMQRHGAELATFIGDRTQSAAEAGRAASALRSIVDDLSAKRDCEQQSSCVSGRASGGQGPVWRALDALAGRAQTVGDQLTAGEAARASALAALDAALADYQHILADDGEDIWARRGELQLVDARIRQQAAQLSEAMPLALISAYAEEVKAGVTVADRPEATTALAAITQKQAQVLETVVGSITATAGEPPPAFPPRPGVGDTLGFIGHFIPVAAIAAVVEIVFPSTLWLFTYWGLRWDIYRREAVIAAAPPPAAEPRRAAPKLRAAVPAIEQPRPRLIAQRKPGDGDDGASLVAAGRGRLATVRRKARRPD
ncbi:MULTISPECIES: hypothetical protein [unclassified Devosia]|uniref:hypothetical protein n=1 Tax=unclassified Devosia TaxID=196773 RepID=UPI001AD5E915|nr:MULTISPECIES: hypothetical protein [unclassified Devosia]MBN9304890.1 hypothetical protein [Devosia sp.]